VDRAGGERGVTAVAYALMVAIVAVLLVGGVVVLGDSIRSAFDHGGDCLAVPSECDDSAGTGTGNGGGGSGGSNGTTTTRPASTTTTTIGTATAP
jgi:Flp pilus assembly pilin Flp